MFQYFSLQRISVQVFPSVEFFLLQRIFPVKTTCKLISPQRLLILSTNTIWNYFILFNTNLILVSNTEQNVCIHANTKPCDYVNQMIISNTELNDYIDVKTKNCSCATKTIEFRTNFVIVFMCILIFPLIRTCIFSFRLLLQFSFSLYYKYRYYI